MPNLRWRKPPGVIGNAKIDAGKAAAIRAQGGQRTQADLAAEHGISRSMVGLILRGKAWPEARA